jgi:hypothetical protein
VNNLPWLVSEEPWERSCAPYPQSCPSITFLGKLQQPPKNLISPVSSKISKLGWRCHYIWGSLAICPEDIVGLSAHRWPGVQRMASCLTIPPEWLRIKQMGAWGQPTENSQWMTVTRCANVFIGLPVKRGVSRILVHLVWRQLPFRICHCKEGRPIQIPRYGVADEVARS